MAKKNNYTTFIDANDDWSDYIEKAQEMAEQQSSPDLAAYAKIAYVNNLISTVKGGEAPASLDTIHEIAAKLLIYDHLHTELGDSIAAKVDASTVYTKTEIDNKGFLTASQLSSNYATKDYVGDTINAVVGSAPEALDTLEEIAVKLQDNDEAYSAIISVIGGKLSKDDADELYQPIGNYQPAGNYLTEHQSLDAYLTKTEAAETYAAKGSAVEPGEPTDLSAYLTKTEAAEVYQPAGEYLTEHQDLSDYATKAEIEEAGYLTEHQDISHLAVKSAVDTQIDAVSGELNTFVAQVAENYQPKGNYQPAGEYLTEHQSLAAYATKFDVSTAIADIIGGAPETYDTLKELADALENNATLTNIANAIATKANAADVYTKIDADAKFLVNNDISTFITEEAANEAYQPKGTYLTEHQSLAAYATKEEVAETYQPKGEYLTEHQDLTAYVTKAEIEEAGYLTENLDLSAYLTKEEADDTYQPKGEYLTEHQDLSAYATKEEVAETYQPKGEYLTEHQDLTAYATKSEVEEAGYLTEHQDLSAYLTKEEADDTYQPKGEYLTEHQDLSTYATKSEVEEAGYLTEHQSLAAYATKEEVAETYQPKGEYLTEHQDLSAYATKEEVAETYQPKGNYQPAGEYLTEHQDLSAYLTKQDAAETYQPAGEYLLEHQDLTAYATKEYVTEKLSDIVGAAPDTLDTFEEIAALLDSSDGTVIRDVAQNASAILALKQRMSDLERFVRLYVELTPAQEQQIENSNTIQETLYGGANKSVEITEGTVADVMIPQTTQTTTVTAPLAQTSIVTVTSPKSVTVNNTSDTSANVEVNGSNQGTSNTSVTLNGLYDTITLNNANLTQKDTSALSSEVTNIIVTEDTTYPTTISAVFAEESTITSDSSVDLIIGTNNYQAANPVVPSLTINAEQSTVSMSGNWDTVTSSVGEDTLILNYAAHFNKLIVNKGNVRVHAGDVSYSIAEVENETEYTVEPFYYEPKNKTELCRIMSSSYAGVYTLQNDISFNGNIGAPIFGAGYSKLYLNGHSIETNYGSSAGIYLRGTCKLDIYGEGSFTNTNQEGYGVWVNADTCELNVYGGDFTGYTHVLYAYKGTINVYGGSFKCLSADKTFTLNCYDANYTNGTAHINVYGGKFYDWNPAATMGEPGSPVSFVANGYKVISYTEDESTVYEVVPDEGD